jgi:hypothetical protein
MDSLLGYVIVYSLVLVNGHIYSLSADVYGAMPRRTAMAIVKDHENDKKRLWSLAPDLNDPPVAPIQALQDGVAALVHARENRQLSSIHCVLNNVDDELFTLDSATTSLRRWAFRCDHLEWSNR